MKLTEVMELTVQLAQRALQAPLAPPVLRVLTAAMEPMARPVRLAP